MRFRPPAPPSELLEHVTRRDQPPTPFRRHRLGMAGGGVLAEPIDFPGIAVPEHKGWKSRGLSFLLALLLHGSVFTALFLLSTLAPEPEKEKIVPVRLIKEIPNPQPDPAPARRALAERRSVNFGPAAQAVAPQVINPRVVARATPAVRAEAIKIDGVTSVAAPRQVTRSNVSVETVKAVTSVAGVEVSRVDVADAAAPALRAPIETDAPAGPSAGPRAIVNRGNTVGTGPANVREAGSSVLDGVDSDRDVLGSSRGPRLAGVNTRVGEGHLAGPGGTGTGSGGIGPARTVDCLDRPEVQNYMNMIRDRVTSRWVQGNYGHSVAAQLRFKLDVAGSARTVELISSDDPRLGKEAVDAMRASSPFPAMSDKVRCLAKDPLLATFRLNSSIDAG